VTLVFALVYALLPGPEVDVVSGVVKTRAAVLKRAVLTDKQVSKLTSAVIEASVTHGIKVSLILAVIEAESAYQVMAVSTAACVGMMQMNPKTAPEVAKSVGLRRYDLRNISHGVILGTAYLKQLFVRYSRWDHALTAYNKGPGRFRAQRFAVSRYARDIIKKQSRLELELYDPRTQNR
jgi:soluble lytic murein transglycosylase-like protein